MMQNDTEFTIKCKMRSRWVPHFLGMLKTMERLGGLGASRVVSMYADGDGDFRPKFEWDASLPAFIKVDETKIPPDKGFFFDAG